MTNPSCSQDSENQKTPHWPTGLTRLNWVVAGRDVNTIFRYERTRALLPRAPRLRGQGPQMRGLGRDEHKTGLCWGPLPCALQRLEADVRLLPALILIPPSDFPFRFFSSVLQLGRVGPYGAPPQI